MRGVSSIEESLKSQLFEWVERRNKLKSNIFGAIIVIESLKTKVL